MIPFFRWLTLGALVATALQADPVATELFNGKDLAGWSFVNPKGEPIAKVAQVTPAGVLVVTGKPTGYLLAQGVHSNYRLHVEYRWLKPKGNSGVFVHISSGPVAPKPWPLCLQVQNHDQHTGELIPMGGFTFDGGPADGKIYDLRHPPKENPVGEWNTCDITCQGDTVIAVVNGLEQNRALHCSPSSGQIGLQLEGYPFEIRALRLTPL
jgi:hypothetical protein